MGTEPGPLGRAGPVDLAHIRPFHIGPVEVRPASREVVRGARRETLEPRVMQVLVTLASVGGQIMSRDDLIAACWEGRAVSDDAINRVLSRLRALARTFGAFQLETIVKVGYRLVELGDAPQVLVESEPQSVSRRSAALCVLPFVNMSGDAEQEYFSDGISEDITTDLSKVSALTVVARHTAFTLKGSSLDVTEIARKLGVTHVIEGSVRKAGDRVRISAQLIDGATGDQLWAERYDRELTDIFAIQDEISRAIVAALKLTLLPEEKELIEQRGTTSAEAYSLYLMARKDWITGNYGDVRRDERVARICQRAVGIDPRYARAWALMALAQANLRGLGRDGDGGLASAERALSIDPDIAEAHCVLARNLLEQGRSEEADAEISIALRLDPGSWEVNREAGRLRTLQRRIPEAIQHYEKEVSVAESDHYGWGMLTQAYKVLGDPAAMRRAAKMSVAQAEKALEQDASNGAALSVGAAGLAALGESDRAREWMKRGLLVDPDNLTMRYNFGCVLALHLSDPDEALAALRPALDRGGATIARLAGADSDLDSLRDDARFKKMLADARARHIRGDSRAT